MFSLLQMPDYTKYTLQFIYLKGKSPCPALKIPLKLAKNFTLLLQLIMGKYFNMIDVHFLSIFSFVLAQFQ